MCKFDAAVMLCDVDTRDVGLQGSGSLLAALPGLSCYRLPISLCFVKFDCLHVSALSRWFCRMFCFFFLPFSPRFIAVCALCWSRHDGKVDTTRCGFARQRQPSFGTTPDLRKLAYLFAAFNLCCTIRISLDHGFIMRCVDCGYVPVRMRAAGGTIAVVAIGLFVCGTGLNEVTVGLGLWLSRFHSQAHVRPWWHWHELFHRCFLPDRWVRRVVCRAVLGQGAWLLEDRSQRVLASARLCLSCSSPAGVSGLCCRRPERGISTGHGSFAALSGGVQKSEHGFHSPLSLAECRSRAWVCWSAAGGVQIRGSPLRPPSRAE